MTPKQWLTLSDGSILTRQEQFVVRQVAAGEIADLKQEFGEAEVDRRLRARFLEELLTGELKGVKVHRQGVKIKNVVIDEPIDLDNAEIPFPIELYSFVFMDFVSFSDAIFKNNFILLDSYFFDCADFYRMKVEKSFFCEKCVFENKVNFGSNLISFQFGMKETKFLDEEQEVIFNGIQVGKDASLERCEFYGGVDLCGAEIKGQLIAQKLKVLSEEKKADLNGLKVGQAAFFNEAEFHGFVDFGGAQIRSFEAQWTKFLSNDLKASFNGMQAEIGVFDDAEFHGPVNFVSSKFQHQFRAMGTKFLSKDFSADFNSMYVGQVLRLDGAEFYGPVHFHRITIGEQLVARQAKFMSGNHKTSFNSMQVGQNAFFDESEFHGEADFVGSDIKGYLLANGAKFLSSDHKVSFTQMQVGQDARFRGCDFHGIVSFIGLKLSGDLHLDPLLKSGLEMSTTFHGGVNFRGADIGGELQADKAHFLGHIADFEAVRVGRSFHASGALFAGSVYFSRMEVKSNFYINPFERMKSFKTLFKGAANFSDVEVHGVFNADQAIFQSESVIFSGLKVGQGAFFIGTIFVGGLVLKEGQLTDLVIRGLHRLSKGGLPLTEIILNRTKIAHRLTIEDVEVKRFNARNLEVKGPTEFGRLLIKDEADFRDAACHHLQMVEVDWPEPRDGKEKVFLDGLTYESITTRKEPDKPEDWPKLLAWLGLSRFNTQNYGHLEDYLQRGGKREQADKVFIEGKRRAWRRRSWLSPNKWGLLLFWDWLAGYGRKPGRIFWVSLAIILIGACTFEPHFQEVNGWLAQLDGQHPWISRFLLSLNRFFPIVDLGMFNIWSPAPLSTFAGIWYQVEKICGWILIPIGLAAVYTRLK
ncbi:MAG: hypothetical protein ACHQ2F_04070 [Desulfobaccales bacterium]